MAKLKEVDVPTEGNGDRRETLLTMKFSVQEVEFAISRLGEEAPVNELVNLIVASQIAKCTESDENDPTHGNDAKGKEVDVPTEGNGDRRETLLTMKFSVEEVEFAISRLGEEAPVNELVNLIVASQIVKCTERDEDDPTHGNDAKGENQNVEEDKLLVKLLKASKCLEHLGLYQRSNDAFCIPCERYLCAHCLSLELHDGHQIVKVYKHHQFDALLLGDVQEVLLHPCSSVQTYYIKSGEVVYIKSRPGGQRGNPSSYAGSSCAICKRKLSDVSKRFCSLECLMEFSAAEAAAATVEAAAAATAAAAEAAVTTKAAVEATAEASTTTVVASATEVGTVEAAATTDKAIAEAAADTTTVADTTTEDATAEAAPAPIPRRKSRKGKPRRAPFW